MSLSLSQQTLLQYNNLQLPDNLQVVIVYTEWNEPIVNELKAGALRILSTFENVHVHTIQVPGCIEINHALYQVMHHEKYNYITQHPTAYIAFGCVIKGETPHFEYVCNAVTQGITHLQVTQSAPIIFGILTVLNEAQAVERIGGKHGHKGEEAAIAALKMMSLKVQQVQ